MTSTASVPAPPRRLVLVPVGPPAGRGDASVRRYRLARLRLEGREVAREERFAHRARAGAARAGAALGDGRPAMRSYD